MKKTRFALLLAALLLLSFAAVGEEETFPAEYFRSVYGRISFTVPNTPDIIHEPDYEGVWTEKTQFHGFYHDLEYQVHIADLSQYVAGIEQSHPGEDPLQYQLNAMMNMTDFYIGLYDGEFETVEPFAGKRDDDLFPGADFTFRFPDMPDALFRGKAIMDGGKTVVMWGQDGEETVAFLKEMTVLTLADAEAFLNRPPETAMIGEMTFTFPCPAGVKSEASCWAFGAGFTEMSVIRVNPFDLGEGDDAALEQAALKQISEALGIDNYHSTSFEKIADGAYLLTFKFDQIASGTDYVERRFVCKLYMSQSGAYLMSADDNDMGNAFLDSAVFEPHGTM